MRVVAWRDFLAEGLASYSRCDSISVGNPFCKGGLEWLSRHERPAMRRGCHLFVAAPLSAARRASLEDLLASMNDLPGRARPDRVKGSAYFFLPGLRGLHVILGSEAISSQARAEREAICAMIPVLPH